MGLKFSSFAIKGIDVSQFNGTIDWSKTSGCNFAAIRVGYGRTLDTKFTTNWAGAKNYVKRIPYWYMDYYSNHTSSSSVNGTSDADWGIAQANTCWNAIKNDCEGIVFLDIESASASVASAITTVASRAQAIAKAFLQQMDTLNGKTNGIYCSVGMLNWFASWFKNRPLWAAWYNENQTIATVKAAVTKAGWTGTPLIWQYASDGDINDDGTGDGTSLGMQYKDLDLNAWLGSSTDYSNMFSSSNSNSGSSSSEDSEDESDETEITSTVLYKVKVTCNKLNIRSGPGITYSRLRKASLGEVYSIYEVQNTFGRISPTSSEWMSISTQYVEKVDDSTATTNTSTVNETSLYQVKVLIYNLSVRSGPGPLYTWLRRANYPGTYNIYEEKNNYGRISTTEAEWINLSTSYVQKLTSTSKTVEIENPVENSVVVTRNQNYGKSATMSKTELSDVEKLERLWAAHPELH